jgi:hypothetical protein
MSLKLDNMQLCQRIIQNNPLKFEVAPIDIKFRNNYITTIITKLKKKGGGATFQFLL